jgi:hypothetical protein
MTIIENDRLLRLVDKRKTDNSQLWIAGCSFSHGIGVDPDCRYGQLVANQLDMSVSFLTCGGSSIPWASDQILRSDVKNNDIVIWGLTAVARMPCFYKNKIEHLNINYYRTKGNIDPNIKLIHLFSDTRIYEAITSIHRVINFCNKLNVKLIIVNLLDIELNNYLHNIPNYISLVNCVGTDDKNLLLDYGSDNVHPGILTHQYYANEILKNINYI